MFRLGSSISLAVALALTGASVTSTEPIVAGPRMVGDVDAGKLYVEDAAAVGEDLAFLGTRGRERLSLRWFDADRQRERKLQTVSAGDMARALGPARDGIIFTGFRQRQGTEPWRSDGTRARTKLIREIHTGRQLANCVPATPCSTYPAGSDPQSFLTVGRTSYFAANHPRHGMELWRTDGTRKGTKLVRDVWPGTGSGLESAARSLMRFDGRVYFVADDGIHGKELWHTDGTRRGTRMVRDIGPGHSVAWWSRPVAAGDLLYFVAMRKDEGAELWRTDGTSEGTRLVRDIRRGRKTSDPRELTALGEWLYFTADDRKHGRELWRTDGTDAEMVTDLTPGRDSSALFGLVAVGDTLYLTNATMATDEDRLGELWRVVATTAGIEPVDLGFDGSARVGRKWSEYATFATQDERLFIAADDGVHGNELWVIDPALDAPALLSDVRPGPIGSDPEWLTLADGWLYFSANDGTHGRQLWALPLESPTDERAET